MINVEREINQEISTLKCRFCGSFLEADVYTAANLPDLIHFYCARCVEKWQKEHKAQEPEYDLN